MVLWTYVIKWSLHSSESKMLTELARDAFEIIEHFLTQVLFFAALSLWLAKSSKEKVGSALWYTCLGRRSNANLSTCLKAKQTRGGMLVSKDLNRKMSCEAFCKHIEVIQEMSPFPKEPFEGFLIESFTQLPTCVLPLWTASETLLRVCLLGSWHLTDGHSPHPQA